MAFPGLQFDVEIVRIARLFCAWGIEQMTMDSRAGILIVFNGQSDELIADNRLSKLLFHGVALPMSNLMLT